MSYKRHNHALGGEPMLTLIAKENLECFYCGRVILKGTEYLVSEIVGLIFHEGCYEQYKQVIHRDRP